MQFSPARPRVPYTFGPLYEVLQKAFPDHRSIQQVFDVTKLAKDLDLSHETIYRAVRTDVIKIGIALIVLKFSHEHYPMEPLYWDDLLPFILPEFEAFSNPSRKP